MANVKKNNNVKLSNNKKNNPAIKKNNINVNANKKNRNTKKKIDISDKVEKEVKEAELVKKPTKKKPVKNVNINNITIENKVLTQEEIALQKKERNRKKYENQQRKYQYAKKNKVKKKVVIPDELNNKQEVDVEKEEKLVKKKETTNLDTKDKIKEKERKEKRKLNRKSVHFTKTLVNIKNKGASGINLVKEKTSDKNIPVGKSEEEKKRKFKRIIKEAIVYSILLTIIDVICILVLDYFDFLRLFDVKALNIIITIIISLIINFFIAFMIDHFVTEIWLKRKRKKEVDINGDNRINEGEYKEDIQEKEGE